MLKSYYGTAALLSTKVHTDSVLVPLLSVPFSQGIESCGFKSHGGQDAPYVYVDLEGRPSWDVFSEILEKAQVRLRLLRLTR